MLHRNVPFHLWCRIWWKLVKALARWAGRLQSLVALLHCLMPQISNTTLGISWTDRRICLTQLLTQIVVCNLSFFALTCVACHEECCCQKCLFGPADEIYSCTMTREIVAGLILLLSSTALPCMWYKSDVKYESNLRLTRVKLPKWKLIPHSQNM